MRSLILIASNFSMARRFMFAPRHLSTRGIAFAPAAILLLKLRKGVCVPFLRIQKQGGNHAKIDFMGGRYCGCFGGGCDDWQSFAGRCHRTNRLE